MLKIAKNNLISLAGLLALCFGLILIPSFDAIQAASPNLVITNAVDKTTAKPGDILTFTLSYQNTGQGNATEVKMINIYSQTYLEMSIAGDGITSDGQIDWNLGTLAPGVSSSKTFKLKVKENITKTVRLFNTAIINSNETPSVQSNTLEIVVTPSAPVPNNPPVANAGPDVTVYENQTVVLNGAGSYDPNGDPITFSWACAAGALSNSTTSQPTFNAPSVNADTNYTCSLTVTDNKGLSSSDTVQILVRDNNRAPVIQVLSMVSEKVGQEAVIELAGYDANGDELTYNFTGQGILTKVSNGRAVWRWTPNAVGNYTFTFTVQDGRGGTNSITAAIQITQ